MPGPSGGHRSVHDVAAARAHRRFRRGRRMAAERADCGRGSRNQRGSGAAGPDPFARTVSPNPTEPHANRLYSGAAAACPHAQKGSLADRGLRYENACREAASMHGCGRSTTSCKRSRRAAPASGAACGIALPAVGLDARGLTHAGWLPRLPHDGLQALPPDRTGDWPQQGAQRLCARAARSRNMPTRDYILGFLPPVLDACARAPRAAESGTGRSSQRARSPCWWRAATSHPRRSGGMQSCLWTSRLKCASRWSVGASRPHPA